MRTSNSYLYFFRPENTVALAKAVSATPIFGAKFHIYRILRFDDSYVKASSQLFGWPGY